MHGNFKDITGQKFNMLTAIELVEIKKGVGAIWKFRCDCGNVIKLPAGRVKFGTTKSCGCINHKRNFKDDLTGKIFGKWTVIEKCSDQSGVKWLCKCKCGNYRKINASDLKNGKSKNCGCERTADLTGMRFGKWLVIKRGENKGKEVRWVCKCDCGNVKTVSAASLKKGTSTNCGCEKIVDLSGKRFGKLLVIEKAERHITESGQSVQMWRCICDCGNETIVRHSNLQSGNTISCGCYHNEKFGDINRSHNLSNKSHLYGVWKTMKDRCYREKSKSYKNYGGRGISVCDEWRNDYKAFYDWSMKNGYKEEQNENGVNILSIDRIDNDGNYEPSNCRWVTADIQAKNKRRKK